MNRKDSEGRYEMAAEFDHTVVNENGLFAFQVGGMNISELDLKPFIGKYQKMLQGGEVGDPTIIFAKDRCSALVVFTEA